MTTRIAPFGWKAVAAAVAASALFMTGCSSDPDQADGSGEVFLEAAADIGPDPFTDSVAASPSAFPSPEEADESAEPDASETKNDGGGGPDDSAGTEVTADTGTEAGLYGGSLNAQVCDRGQLISFLEGNPDKAAAWADALNVSVGEISVYVGSLAPVILRQDTRVTNYGYADGQATPRQSILETGTAVLVDDFGMPRVRCECGNPLNAPIAVSSGPDYVGTPWDGFDSATVVRIDPGEAVKVLIVISIETGEEIEVPVGRGGQSEPTAAGSPSASASASGSPTTSGSSSASPTNGGGDNAEYTNCTRRYGELVRDLTLAGGIDPSDAERWAGQAEEAAEKANSGDVVGATEIICGSVSEMEAVLAGG